MKKFVIFLLAGISFIPSSIFAQTQEKNINIDTDFIQVDITYPVLGNAMIDSQIETYVQGVYQNFMEDAQLTTEDNASMEYPFYTQLSMHYTLTNNDENIVSIVFSNYVFMGGAHGLPSVQSFVFDTKTGKIFSLNDDIIKKLSKISFTYLKKYFDENGGSGDDEWIKTGTDPDKVNYTTFSISLKDGKVQNLTLYFQAYQVAAYAAGMPTLSIDRETGITVNNF